MKCPICTTTMYEHDHVREVFALSQPDIRRMFGCTTCHASVTLRDDNTLEVTK